MFAPRLAIASATCLLAFAAGLDAAERNAIKLPDIGSSAAALATPQELREYGAGMLQELRAYDLVLDDPLLSDYISSLGYRLVAASERADSGFTFFIVRDQQINAFAAPGGYVAVNAGLMIAMDSEDELAGVLAHEISHVQQQHILRAFEDQQKMSLPIMLAMLGVMIAAAGRNDDAAPAALVAGQSIMIQRQINFTRGDEAEADRVGIQLLARAGFDPNAMAGAFQQLQKVMRVNGIDVPEFLRDHP
ncbi:MAG: M48 family metalloprotease, partial [Dokdonella sp.]|nr:M48 family metalloprotease [Dokdonella sp.]